MRDVPLLQRQQISLVDEQQRPPLSTLEVSLRSLSNSPSLNVQTRHVVLEISTPESFGITSIYDLHNEMRSLEDSPELSPNLEVSLEGSEEEVVALGEAEKEEWRGE